MPLWAWALLAWVVASVLLLLLWHRLSARGRRGRRGPTPPGGPARHAASAPGEDGSPIDPPVVGHSGPGERRGARSA